MRIAYLHTDGVWMGSIVVLPIIAPDEPHPSAGMICQRQSQSTAARTPSSVHFLCNPGSQAPARHCSSPRPLIPAELLSCMTRPGQVKWAGSHGLFNKPGAKRLNIQPWLWLLPNTCISRLHCIGLVGLLALVMLVLRPISHCALRHRSTLTRA